MIIIFAGSQPDDESRKAPRLPETAEMQIAIRIRGLLQSLKPRLVVGALAAGSDIIFGESARLEGVETAFLLPFSVQTFRETSVESHGSRWTARYDRIVAEAAVQTLDLHVEEDSYLRHNAAMLDLASQLAEPDERIWCIVVRPKPEVGRESVTDDMVDRAEGRGFLTIDLDPLASRPRAFVAMAYGTKFDPVSKRNVDCDSVFHRVYKPVLEDLNIDWSRADLATDSGIIHVGMLDDLANSDLVVADLTAINFNVAYEVGVRHVLARRSTVLVHPKVNGLRSSSPPFDVAILRVHSFARSLVLTDQEAEAAVQVLRPILKAAVDAGHTDSPFHEWFDADAIEAPFTRRSDPRHALDLEIEIRTAVRTAIRSSAAQPMLTAAAEVAVAALDESTRRSLRIELAVALLGELEYRDSLELLSVAEPPTDDPLHRLWLHSSVMALRHVGENTESVDERLALLERAESLLRQAIDIGYSDSESYGIWAGMLKRRLMRGDLAEGVAAEATFRLMVEYYELGFRADPQAYTGVNLVMAVRVRGNTEPLNDDDLRRLQEALIVSRFLNQLDLERDSTDLWAAVTEAELLLHAALVEGLDTSPAVTAYARASSVMSPQVRKSAIDQLNFMKVWGDPPELIDPIIGLLGPQH